MSTTSKFAGTLGSNSGRVCCSQAQPNMHSIVQIMYDSEEPFRTELYSSNKGRERLKDITTSLSHLDRFIARRAIEPSDLIVMDGKVYLYINSDCEPKELSAVEVAKWFSSTIRERIQMIV